jgi:hypothetical protein
MLIIYVSNPHISIGGGGGLHLKALIGFIVAAHVNKDSAGLIF